MKNKLIGRKEAGIASTFSDFWGYVIFVFIVLIFAGFFNFQANSIVENKITGASSSLNKNIILLNFLRSPVEIESNGIIHEIDMAELIRLWFFDKNKYGEILEGKAISQLNFMEYKGKNPYAENMVLNTFSIIIMEEKPFRDSINPIKQYKSKNYNVPDTGAGKLNLGQVIIPISSLKNLHIVLRVGYVDESIAK